MRRIGTMVIQVIGLYLPPPLWLLVHHHQLFHFNLLQNEISAAVGDKQQLAADRAFLGFRAGGYLDMAAVGAAVAYGRHLYDQLCASHQVIVGGEDVKAELEGIDDNPAVGANLHGNADDPCGFIFCRQFL